MAECGIEKLVDQVRRYSRPRHTGRFSLSTSTSALVMGIGLSFEPLAHVGIEPDAVHVVVHRLTQSAPQEVVIGVDGVRFDLLNPVTTPALWELGRDGFLAKVILDETTPSWSAPSWATIATGAGVAGHGITSNDMTGHRLAGHPDFLTLATRAGLSTMLAIGGWAPLALGEDGGPLFAEATRREFFHPPDSETMPVIR